MEPLSAIGRRYGWRPDPPSLIEWFDHRKLFGLINLPEKTANRQYVNWCYDQLQESSCTANSAIAANRYFRATHGLPDFLGSRQFLYHVTGQIEGDEGQDNGATIADTVEAEAQYGICLEATWTYDQPVTVHPSEAAYQEAAKHVVLAKEPVEQTQQAIESAIVSMRPVQYGMTVYPSFEEDEVKATGIVPMPGLVERFKPLGGHALWLFDYDRTAGMFYGQNSWGRLWGQDGRGIFSIPYDYILDSNLASDFWCVDSVKE